MVPGPGRCVTFTEETKERRRPSDQSPSFELPMEAGATAFKRGLTCHYCGEPGHKAYQCEKMGEGDATKKEVGLIEPYITPSSICKEDSKILVILVTSSSCL
ncbi:unnamed protein product [Cyprideis torosa]|uniref:Uncharacterized protein n=1 Tax=Cyprideis torosa TaxID=163714 RepID=A0A7R8WDL2_9CRUS|nr:unnamed protein product [Cyprideis torosa]CAG0894848.1 unnamed protein product [Cyprideis torosa]